ncbi:MAG: GNAT family N-acetyltransferase [Balneolaceae bacterium]|nr:GNAT family N-acetyltransferase [Balneolaceae bacterium]
MEAYIYLEAHIKAIETATDFTYRWCINMGMDYNEAARFTLAVDELLTNMILFAYPDTDGYIEIWYRYSVPQLEIIIQESGEPFDPDRYRYSPEKAMNEGDFEGAGLELVRNLTDHFLFLNRGKQGKEFRLVKQLAVQNLNTYREEDTADGTAGDDHSYTLAAATKEDAEDIAKLIYRSYHYSYSKEGLYFPKQNELALEHGKKFGTIVRTEEGRPVGYFSVIKDPDSMVGEVAEAVVSPPHRQQGLMTRMLNELIDTSKKRGLQGLYGLALTVHEISQRVNHNFDFVSTALLVGVTKGAKYKDFVADHPQPVSLLVDYLPLTSKRNPQVWLPSRYRSILQQIYRLFDITPALLEGEVNGQGSPGKTELDLEFTYRNKTAMVVVKNIGNNVITAAHSMLRSLEEVDLNAIYIDIPLQHRDNEETVEWLHRNGFIFAGLMPMKYSEKDYLRLQKILVPIDFSLITTYSAMATDIKQFIFNEYHEIFEKR